MLVNPDFTLPPLESVVRTPAFGRTAFSYLSLVTIATMPCGCAPTHHWMLGKSQPHPSGRTDRAAQSVLVDELLVDFRS